MTIFVTNNMRRILEFVLSICGCYDAKDDARAATTSIRNVSHNRICLPCAPPFVNSQNICLDGEVKINIIDPPTFETPAKYN